jgi:hypothetical protein
MMEVASTCSSQHTDQDILAMINTRITLFQKEPVMDITTQHDSPDDNQVEADREIIRPILDDIAQEVGNKLREAGLSLQVFLTVPRSGNAIATMATPADPTTGVWLSVTRIVSKVVSDRLDGMTLRSRELPCAMADTTMSAADLTAD